MKIGNVNIKNKIFLAPMAGVTDSAFRLICKQQGCGLVYSEMVSSKGMMYESKNTKKLLEIDDEEEKVALQLFGSNPQVLAETAARLDSEDKIAIFDINMGCPAPKITKNGDGSALMLNPKLIGQIVSAVSKATKKPVTIKIRKGYDDNNLNAFEIAKIAESSGAAAIAIHGRTREQFYSGNADWDIIKKIKQHLSIPVIGNGDIDSPQKAKEIFEYTGCDAIMIGRAAQGNPWIFKRVIHYLNTGEILSEPTFKERIEMALFHLKKMVELKGEIVGVREMRKHIGWYIKGLPKSAEMRVIINKISEYNEMKNILENIICF